MSNEIELSVKGRIRAFMTNVPEFKQWIEQTSLFNSIKINSKYASTVAQRGDDIIIQVDDGQESFELKLNGTPVETAEDLPMEILQKFALNYPGNSNYNSLKQIQDDTSKKI